MSIYSHPFFKLSLLPVLFSHAFSSIANGTETETTDEYIEVLGAQYTKPITISEPGQTTVDWQEVEEQQYSNFASLVDSVPGAHLDGGARSGGERINIRGFSNPSDIAVFVDGAPIGFQQYRYGTFFFDPFLIGEAEIVKGAHDYRALNGKFGGTIHIKTKTVDDLLTPGESFGFRVNQKYNTNGDAKAYNLSLYGKSDSGFYYIANGSVTDSDDIRVGGASEDLDYSGYEQENMLFKVGYENDHHQFEVSHTRYKDEGRKPWANRRGDMPTITNRNIEKYGSLEAAKYAYTTYNEYTDNTTTISYNYSPSNPYIDFNIKAARSENDRHWVRPDIAFEKMYVSVGSYGHESWLSYSRDFIDVYNTAVLGDHTLVTGLQYQKTDRDSLVFNATQAKKEAKNYGWYTPYYEPSGIQRTYAAYAADHYQATPNFTISPSLRYEYVTSKGKGNAASDYNDPSAGHDYSETTHKGFSPRLDLDYEATANTRLNFSYAYAMKTPTVDNLYSVQYSRARASASARDLEVSRIHAYQASIINITDGLFRDSDSIGTELTLFYNDVSDHVHNRVGGNLDRDTNENQSWNTNLDGYKNYGFELINQYRIADFFSDFSVAYVRGKYKGSLSDSTGSDEDFPSTPPLNINLGLGYEWSEGLTTGWKLRWYDAQTKTGEDKIYSYPVGKQYTLQDIYATWEVQQVKGLSFGAIVTNLTDRYYEAYLSKGVASPGREIKLNAAYQF
ncbi:TonB-dependent receptor domain-containing protein [Vibrio splendidus]|uniref:TonB-dependent receptor domain-containing protein n=1 Tax=Vibrio splendidus TaxID=29497 RepID=UPI0022354C07|nr:TonB-dependent receptor [Vibrio splendidus]MCW4438525.1 TonB-dependent receptor [Vibrio splendidus]